MKTSRIEAFSDGVLAIIITIMVLELHIPKSASFGALIPLLPKFIAYLMSFVYVGIYWNNHHHLFHAIEKVNGKVMWANLFLLFSLSLLPFTSAWMGENHYDKAPMFLYGLDLFLCAYAYAILEKEVVKYEGEHSKLKQAVGNYLKEWLSIGFYLAGMGLSFVYPPLGFVLYLAVALLWVIPDKRIEKRIQ